MIANGFSNQSKFFSKRNMAYLATCARIAYFDKEQLARALTREGFDLDGQDFFFEDKKTDTQGYVVGDRNKIIVAFRGSEAKLKDWETNFSFRKEPWTKANPLGQVHDGFADAFYRVRNDVVTRIQALRTHNQPIWYTGHSLGGALAVMAASTLLLHEEKLPVAGLYTFGQPRVGDFQFAKTFNRALKGRAFRFVNNNDVVPQVPLEAMGFSHAGQLKYFDHRGRLRGDRSRKWWFRFWDRVEGRVEHVVDLANGVSTFKFVPPDGIDDHDMRDYETYAYRAARLPLPEK